MASGNIEHLTDTIKNYPDIFFVIGYYLLKNKDDINDDDLLDKVTDLDSKLEILAPNFSQHRDGNVIDILTEIYGDEEIKDMSVKVLRTTILKTITTMLSQSQYPSGRPPSREEREDQLLRTRSASSKANLIKGKHCEDSSSTSDSSTDDDDVKNPDSYYVLGTEDSKSNPLDYSKSDDF